MAEIDNKEEKGKGRATSDEPPNDVQTPSMLSSLTSSAKALVSDALTAPSSRELSYTTEALANSGKGQTATTGGTGSSAWPDSSKISQLHRQTSGPSHALRTGHTQEHVAQSEQEFSSFLNSTDNLTTPEESLSLDSHGFNILSQNPDTNHGFSIPFPTLSVAEQESRDGAEVSAMLSADPREQFEAPEDDIPQEAYEWGLSPEAAARLREITKDLLPHPPQHGKVSHRNETILVPRPGSWSPGSAEELNWKAQWGSVLTRYADEVWGGLLPLVKKAKVEIQEMKDDRAPPNSSAIRRLQAILGHLGDYRTSEARARESESRG